MAWTEEGWALGLRGLPAAPHARPGRWQGARLTKASAFQAMAGGEVSARAFHVWLSGASRGLEVREPAEASCVTGTVGEGPVSAELLAV